jgi:hypothetical protein
VGFAEEHEKWLQSHLAKRTGERRDALKRGHGFGNRLFVETVWWNLLGHFHGLHPEYEVLDWRGRSCFVDFMWKVGGQGVVIEIMDYGSHGTDRTKFRLDRNRALYLQSQGFQYVEIALDELKENPGFVMAMLRSILTPYMSAPIDRNGRISHDYSKVERELMRLAVRNNRLIHPSKAARELELHRHTVMKYCRRLVEKGKFRAVPSGDSGRVHQYEYIGSVLSRDLI